MCSWSMSLWRGIPGVFGVLGVLVVACVWSDGVLRALCGGGGGGAPRCVAVVVMTSGCACVVGVRLRDVVAVCRWLVAGAPFGSMGLMSGAGRYWQVLCSCILHDVHDHGHSRMRIVYLTGHFARRYAWGRWGQRRWMGRQPLSWPALWSSACILVIFSFFATRACHVFSNSPWFRSIF